ncbi:MULTISPECIES: hypothetical protein [Streptomyces]|uniref:Uncharacterized protein n=1 Tax=Streptomyces cellulosae TaxID=1968 RepID=A0ABW6JKH9_STRCE
MAPASVASAWCRTQAVLGEWEAADGLAAVRLRDGRRPGVLPVAEFLRRVERRVRAHGTALREPA